MNYIYQQKQINIVRHKMCQQNATKVLHTVHTNNKTIKCPNNLEGMQANREHLEHKQH